MASINCLLHPHHVSLMRNPNTATSILYHLADRVDPYYEYDGLPSHRGLLAPRFNVTETEKAYILDGEVPGISNKKSISVTWLDSQVLIVDGEIKPSGTETATEPCESPELKDGLQAPEEPTQQHLPLPGKSKIDAVSAKPHGMYPRQLLRERRLGGFQRSFTFPDEVDSDGMKATLSDGVLRIVVPKRPDAAKANKTIHVE